MKFPEPEEALSKAGLGRRLAAIFYDSLLCIALMMVTTGVYMMILKAVIGTEDYKAMNDAGSTINDPLLSSVLFITLFLFFGYFWTKNGQTLGMQVWHLRVQNSDQTSITWVQALMRFMAAAFSVGTLGMGYLWMIVDKKDRTFQCIFSDTQIVKIPKHTGKGYAPPP